PLLGRRAAPGRVDNAYGDIERLLQVFTEVVGDSGEPADRVGPTFKPAAVLAADGHRGLRLVCCSLSHCEQPQFRILRLCLDLTRGLAQVYRPFHVRLSAGDPNFADVNLFQNERVVRALKCELVRTTRAGCLNIESPISVLVGSARGGDLSGS